MYIPLLISTKTAKLIRLFTFKQKFVHTLCTFKQKFARTLCMFKQKFVRTLCTFKAYQEYKHCSNLILHHFFKFNFTFTWSTICRVLTLFIRVQLQQLAFRAQPTHLTILLSGSPAEGQYS